MKDVLNNLLPDELKEIIMIAKTLLKELGNTRETNKKYQMVKRKIICPKCHSNESIVKNGHKNNTQRFKCKICNKFFSITTDTIIEHTSLTFEQFITIMDSLINIKSISKVSSEINISPREAYNIRIRILEILGLIMNNFILKEIVEADEKYLRISFKGTRKDKMPRNSRRNGFEDRTSGISNEQICIVFAIDSNDTMIAKVVGNGPASTDMIKKALNKKIERNTILVTDSKSCYIKFASDNFLVLKQVPHGKHTIEEIYNLANVNSLMSEFDLFIRDFRGLSTRHLQEYVNWFIFRKKLKYVVEYLRQNQAVYNYLICHVSNLKSRFVCKISMPFDVNSLYQGSNFK